MRVVVTGKEGQVVQSLLARGNAVSVEIISLGRPDLDLADPSTIRQSIIDARPDVIVSAAAYTAVDKAESETELAFAINASGAGEVARVAAMLNVPIIHLSTDYVFDGTKPDPYVETDETGPVSVYGASKLAGEQQVEAATANHVILRTAWVYSPFGNNFVKTMLRLAETRDHLRVVGDQHGCPTSALDIADAIIIIAKRLVADPDTKLRGIFHLTGSGEATWAEFAEQIFAGLKERTAKMVTVEHITTAEYPTPAKRPANSRLKGDKLLSHFGIQLPDWHASTNIVLSDLV